MAEPSTSTTGLLALFIAVLGPYTGEYALIVFAALGGSLWALGRRTTTDPIAGAKFLLKIFITAILLTSFIALQIEQHFHIPARQAFAPVAFAIGFVGDNWSSLGQAIVDAIRHILAKKSGAEDEQS